MSEEKENINQHIIYLFNQGLTQAEIGLCIGIYRGYTLCVYHRRGLGGLRFVDSNSYLHNWLASRIWPSTWIRHLLWIPATSPIMLLSQKHFFCNIFSVLVHYGFHMCIYMLQTQNSLLRIFFDTWRIDFTHDSSLHFLFTSSPHFLDMQCQGVKWDACGISGLLQHHSMEVH